MKTITNLTILVLLLAVGGITYALVRETAAGPSFRAADYGSFEECLRNIPAAWVEGSVERVGAETACRHEHAPRRAPD